MGPIIAPSQALAAPLYIWNALPLRQVSVYRGQSGIRGYLQWGCEVSADYPWIVDTKSPKYPVSAYHP